MNKRAEMSLEFLVSLIVGVLLASIIGSIAIQVYLARSHDQDSFDNLIAKIKSLNDKETEAFPLQLNSGHVLVSFAGYDFQGDGDCKSTITKPAVCGDAPCLCLCDGSYASSYKNSCRGNRLIECQPIETNIYDVSCSAGLYRTSPESNVLTLYLQKDGNFIRFCTSDSCLAADDEEQFAIFKQIINQYQDCQQQQGDCACSLSSTSQLGDNYALNFYADKVQLYNLKAKQVIAEQTLTTSIAVKNSEKFTDLISFYLFKKQSPTSMGLGLPYESLSWVISPSTKDIVTTGIIEELPDNSLETKSILYKNGGNMFFTNEDLSKITPCRTQVA